MNPVLALLGEITLVFMVALAGAALSTRARAAVRHLILASAFGIALVLPLAMLVSPKITVELAVLPAPVPEARAEPFAVVPVVPAAVAGERAPMAIDAVPASATTRPSMPARSLPFTTWLLEGWASIALFSLLPVVSGLWHLRSIRRRGRPWHEAGRWLDRLRLQAGRRPTVLLDEQIAAPVTGGLLRPVIALPADAAGWSDAHITNALLHELEHVRRHDWAVQLAARAACALYWFHPLAWIAWRSLRLEAERACDDAVLARGDAAGYAQQLLELARRMSDRPVLPGLQMAGNSSLAARIKAVLDSARARGRTGRWLLAGAAVAGGIVIAALAPLRMTGPADEITGMSPSMDSSIAAGEVGSAESLRADPVDPPLPESPTASPLQEEALPAPAPARASAPASPQAVVASILDLVQAAMADESTASLDELTRPITGLHHVQRHALAVLEGGGDPAADAANYTEIINALLNTSNLAANIASRPPRPDLSLPAFQELSAALRGKSRELAAALLPISANPATGASTPQQRAARPVIDLLQATRRDTSFFDPLRGFWLTTELGTLERAAHSLASDDGTAPGATSLKLGALRSSIESTARQASQVAGRANLAPDARSKAAGLAASLREIAASLAPAAVAPATAPVEATWKVSLRSIGPLPIGASLSDVRSIIGDPSAHLVQALRRNRPVDGGPGDPGCAYLASAAVPAQVGLLFQGGRLVRADVWKRGIPTTGEVQVGDSESRLLDTYGSRISAAQDLRMPASARYMTFTPADEADQQYRMRFEMDGNAVAQYRSGLRSAVEQVDGCD